MIAYDRMVTENSVQRLRWDGTFVWTEFRMLASI